MSNRNLRVLVSVFACGPDWGSEVGTGWGWIVALSKYCDLDVIVEKGFEEAIEKKKKAAFADRHVPTFHYIDIGDRARKYFWEQGNWLFYRYYRVWQQKACTCARELINRKQIDIVHQLGMIGFREPGYLWGLEGNFKYVWGPVGGMGELPWCFLPFLGIGTGTKYLIKNVANFFQERMLWRVRQALLRANCVLAATTENQHVLSALYGMDSPVLNETGADLSILASPRPVNEKDELVVVWCGVMEGRKALNLGLRALRLLQERGITVKFDIVGGGHCELAWRRLADSLGLQHCSWYGRLPHSEALAVMKRADVMLITSIREGTPHVLLEGLECGLPIICHDTCGMGSVVTDSCGYKIPLESPQASIRHFAKVLADLNNDRQHLKKLSDGALVRAGELSWDNKAKQMVGYYEKVVNGVSVQ